MILVNKHITYILKPLDNKFMHNVCKRTYIGMQFINQIRFLHTLEYIQNIKQELRNDTSN